MSWPATYERVRQCLPPERRRELADVCRWAPHGARLVIRDRLLAAAAALLTGSDWARAGELVAELAACERGLPIVGAVRELVAEALALDPKCPRSQMQLYSITRCGDAEMETQKLGGEI